MVPVDVPVVVVVIQLGPVRRGISRFPFQICSATSQTDMI